MFIYKININESNGVLLRKLFNFTSSIVGQLVYMEKTVCFPILIMLLETCMSTLCEVHDKLVTGITRTYFVPTMPCIIFSKDLIMRRSNLNRVSMISSPRVCVCVLCKEYLH